MRVIAVVLMVLLAAGPAAAREVFRGDVAVDVGGADVLVPMILDVDAPADSDAALTISILADARPLLNPLGVLLEDDVADLSNACERTVTTPGISVSMAGNRLTLKGQIRAQFRVCGLVKMDVGRETGDVTLAIAPDVAQGRLRFRLAGCRVANLDGLAQLLNVEQKLCAKAAAFLDRLNRDAKVVEPPLGLAAIGYGYSGIRLLQAGRHAFLVGELRGPNDMLGLVDYLSDLRGR